MMCHQYGYGDSIPDECVPFIGALDAPMAYSWTWPDVDAAAAAQLPPYAHAVGATEAKVTTDDSDDLSNDEHHDADYSSHTHSTSTHSHSTDTHHHH